MISALSRKCAVNYIRSNFIGFFASIATLAVCSAHAHSAEVVHVSSNNTGRCISKNSSMNGGDDWVNACGYPIWLRWQDGGLCSDFGCARLVPANGKAFAGLVHLPVTKFACRAPGFPEILTHGFLCDRESAAIAQNIEASTDEKINKSSAVSDTKSDQRPAAPVSGECVSARMACQAGSSVCNKFRQRFKERGKSCPGVSDDSLYVASQTSRQSAPSSGSASQIIEPGDSNTPSSSVDIVSICPNSFIEYWNDASEFPHLTDKIRVQYFDELRNAHDPAKVASLAIAYRTCLNHGLSAVQSDSHNLLNGNSELSDLIADTSRLLVQEAMSELYAPRRADQDPLAAAHLTSEAYGQYRTGMEGARNLLAKQEAEAMEKLAEEERKEQERDEQQKNVGMATALIGGLLLKKYAGASSNFPSQAVHNAYNQAESYHQSRLRIIDRSNDAVQLFGQKLAELEVPKNWSEDGVRLHMPRFDQVCCASGIAQVLEDHTYYIVRIKSADSWCSGAIVGPRLVLTAQHCVLDENGTNRGPLTVSWEYFEFDRAQGFVPREVSVNVTDFTTSSIRYKSSWAADWAFLELEKTLLGDMGYLSLLPPESLPNVLSSRIAVAGYSGDLDDGQFITMDWGCSIAFIKEGVFDDHCTTFSGASGSPIVLSEGPNKSRIVAVNSYGRHGKEKAGHGGGGPSVEQFYAKWKELLAKQLSN